MQHFYLLVFLLANKLNVFPPNSQFQFCVKRHKKISNWECMLNHFPNGIQFEPNKNMENYREILLVFAWSIRFLLNRIYVRPNGFPMPSCLSDKKSMRFSSPLPNVTWPSVSIRKDSTKPDKFRTISMQLTSTGKMRKSRSKTFPSVKAEFERIMLAVETPGTPAFSNFQLILLNPDIIGIRHRFHHFSISIQTQNSFRFEEKATLFTLFHSEYCVVSVHLHRRGLRHFRVKIE